MKTTKSLLAGAALAGIITGGFAAQSQAAINTGAPQFKKGDSTQAGVLADEKEKKEKGATHDCAGKNSCKGKGGCAMKDGKPVHKK